MDVCFNMLNNNDNNNNNSSNADASSLTHFGSFCKRIQKSEIQRQLITTEEIRGTPAEPGGINNY